MEQGTANFIDKTGSGLVNVTSLANEIISISIQLKASDIHIEPKADGLLVRMRVDGILREILCIRKPLDANLLFRIKLEAKMRIDEHFIPQDGRISFNINGRLYDTRVSTVPTTMGEKIVMRLLSKDDNNFALASLGYEGRELEILNKNYIKPYGMILATGPTGSGKTTTLYALLKLLNSKDVNITTIEDPVEYNIDGVNHIQINNQSGLTFANGLRSILRQDPNIIMVGEIRDEETAKIAINSAMTGHMVLSTIHTNDAITTIPRLLDMGVDPFLIASTLTVVIAQRLVRTLCKNCKNEIVLSEEEYGEIKKFRGDIANLIKPGEKIFKAIGCGICVGSGYSGRVGIYEVLEVNETLRRLILAQFNEDMIFQAVRKEGFKLMIENGMDKVKSGITSLDEVMKVTVMKE